MSLVDCANPIVISGTLAFLVASQPSSAQADVRNTYNGAECVARLPTEAKNLIRERGVRATLRTEVVCPIVKAIFNSTEKVEVGIAASGGTSCRLESFPVLTGAPVPSSVGVVPGSDFSTLELTINSSLRGGMQLRCVLGSRTIVPEHRA